FVRLHPMNPDWVTLNMNCPCLHSVPSFLYVAASLIDVPEHVFTGFDSLILLAQRQVVFSQHTVFTPVPQALQGVGQRCSMTIQLPHSHSECRVLGPPTFEPFVRSAGFQEHLSTQCHHTSLERNSKVLIDGQLIAGPPVHNHVGGVFVVVVGPVEQGNPGKTRLQPVVAISDGIVVRQTIRTELHDVWLGRHPERTVQGTRAVERTTFIVNPNTQLNPEELPLLSDVFPDSFSLGISSPPRNQDTDIA